jgi:hypothetical protein
MTDDEHDAHDAHDDRPEEEGREEAEGDEEEVATWPVKGPATPQQAILAIGFVFFLGIVIGFLLCRTF